LGTSTCHTKIDDLCDAYLLAHFFTFHLQQHINFSRLGLEVPDKDDNAVHVTTPSPTSKKTSV
jgi:hypothetical protein